MIQRLIRQFAGGSSGTSHRRRGRGRHRGGSSGIGARLGAAAERFMRGRR